MIGRRIVRALAIALTALTVTALPASAQITTGSVAGSVKDAQGGVIPGATATLISETKNTRSSPVVTGVQGDFVFINVAPDTYTLEISMPSFKTLKRTGIPVRLLFLLRDGNPGQVARNKNQVSTQQEVQIP